MATTTAPGTYAGRRTINLVHNSLLVIAVIALIAGPAYWINGLTQPLVRIDGQITRSISVPVPAGTDPAVSAAVREGSSARVTIYDGRQDGAGVNLSRVTKLVWRSDAMVLGLTIAAGAFMLARLTRDVGAGRPFARRNPRRLAIVAVCVVLGGQVPAILSTIAAGSAFSDAGLAPGEPLAVSATLDYATVLAGLGIMVLAQAFRIGAQVTEDVEGLV